MTDCVFSYCISENGMEAPELTSCRRFGKYTVQTDSRTPWQCVWKENRGCAIFGLAVNVCTGQRDVLAQTILSQCAGIEQVVEFERQLGGKYLILFADQEQYFVLGDATCSIPVCYYTGDGFACSGNPQYLVNYFGETPDPSLQKIRESGEISQAMPFDITPYRRIRQLIPNHYLSVNRKSALRFVNSPCPQQELSVEEATDRAEPMIQAICDLYTSRFSIHCPITSGRDSRVVLAFLAGGGARIPCYTLRHPEHRGQEQDLVIPQRLCAENNLPYEQIPDGTVSRELKQEMDRLLGQGQYAPRTLRLAQTIKEHCGEGAIVNGDLIGQVGKCSLHRDIPQCFATVGYFRCKLHNYSAGAKKYLNLWLREIRSSGECVNPFDLFSIENRLGRWAAQENLIYNTIGQVYLNVFNSRSILYTWTAVSRKERKQSLLHLDLIQRKMPSLLAVPFESDESKLIRLSKANGLTYLLASYAKYGIQSIKFKMGKKNEKADYNGG